ncbi:hypothetical protein CTEN210_12237 [Chaetoceros tenuissimus]|uniref:Ion transport domain-containing protein n=1 Tax=Chaetoceros tenuissimus TaxID=426638 RepID=A0AAD3D2U9_9STRA|nr:hypothetical protein CTEN210_12237 [Chaetoceros tenuissimus]
MINSGEREFLMQRTTAREEAPHDMSHYSSTFLSSSPSRSFSPSQSIPHSPSFFAREESTSIVHPQRESHIRKLYDIIFLFMIITSNAVLILDTLPYFETNPAPDKCNFCHEIRGHDIPAITFHNSKNTWTADTSSAHPCECPPRPGDQFQHVEWIMMMFFTIDLIGRLIMNLLRKEFIRATIEFPNAKHSVLQWEEIPFLRQTILELCATDEIKRSTWETMAIKSIFSTIKIINHNDIMFAHNDEKRYSYEINVFVPLVSTQGTYAEIYEELITDFLSHKFPDVNVKVGVDKDILQNGVPIMFSKRAPSHLVYNLCIDFLVVVSFMAQVFATKFYNEANYVVRCLRMFRVIQLFRLAQYGETAPKFLGVFWDMREKLGMLVIFIAIGSVLIGSLVYWSETGDWEYTDMVDRYAWVRKDSNKNVIDVNPFSSILESMWWFTLVVTKGTVDFHPLSPAGKVFGIATSLFGILITGFIVSAFNESWVYINRAKRNNSTQMNTTKAVGRDFRSIRKNNFGVNYYPRSPPMLSELNFEKEEIKHEEDILEIIIEKRKTIQKLEKEVGELLETLRKTKKII